MLVSRFTTKGRIPNRGSKRAPGAGWVNRPQPKLMSSRRIFPVLVNKDSAEKTIRRRSGTIRVMDRWSARAGRRRSPANRGRPGGGRRIEDMPGKGTRDGNTGRAATESSPEAGHRDSLRHPTLGGVPLPVCGTGKEDLPTAIWRQVRSMPFHRRSVSGGEATKVVRESLTGQGQVQPVDSAIGQDAYQPWREPGGLARKRAPTSRRLRARSHGVEARARSAQRAVHDRSRRQSAGAGGGTQPTGILLGVTGQVESGVPGRRTQIPAPKRPRNAPGEAHPSGLGRARSGRRWGCRRRIVAPARRARPGATAIAEGTPFRSSGRRT